MINNLRAIRLVMGDLKLRRPALEDLVRRRLHAALVSAYRHVPYYRELMNSVGYDPVCDYRLR